VEPKIKNLTKSVLNQPRRTMIQGNEVEVMFLTFATQNYPELPVKKVPGIENLFEVGVKRYSIKLVKGKTHKVVVRVGGGYTEMEEFFSQIHYDRATQLANIAGKAGEEKQRESI